MLGFRFARPGHGREWVALAAYSVALVAQALGARGVLPGGAAAAGTALRLLGAVLLIVGLVVAGTSSRARRRGMEAAPAPTLPPPRIDPVHAGLAVVLLGHLLRQPSVAGGVAAAAAAPFLLFAALAPRRQRGPDRGAGREPGRARRGR